MVAASRCGNWSVRCYLLYKEIRRDRFLLVTLFFVEWRLAAQLQRAAVAVDRLGVVYKTNNNACYGVSIARYFAGERPAAQLEI